MHSCAEPFTLHEGSKTRLYLACQYELEYTGLTAPSPKHQRICNSPGWALKALWSTCHHYLMDINKIFHKVKKKYLEKR